VRPFLASNTGGGGGGEGGDRGAWLALSTGLPALVERGSMCEQDTSL